MQNDSPQSTNDTEDLGTVPLTEAMRTDGVIGEFELRAQAQRKWDVSASADVEQPGNPGDRLISYTRPDFLILDDVARTLAWAPLDVTDIAPQCEGGYVRFAGRLSTPSEKLALERLASPVFGVNGVDLAGVEVSPKPDSREGPGTDSDDIWTTPGAAGIT